MNELASTTALLPVDWIDSENQSVLIVVHNRDYVDMVILAHGMWMTKYGDFETREQAKNKVEAELGVVR